MRPRLSAGLSTELASPLLTRNAAKTPHAHWFPDWFPGSLRVLQAPSSARLSLLLSSFVMHLLEAIQDPFANAWQLLA